MCPTVEVSRVPGPARSGDSRSSRSPCRAEGPGREALPGTGPDAKVFPKRAGSVTSPRPPVPCRPFDFLPGCSGGFFAESTMPNHDLNVNAPRPQRPRDDEVGCAGPGCCGGGAPSRRRFLQAVGAGTAALFGPRLPAVAGPFTPADFERLVPADKKLSPEWVRSLTERGSPARWRGAELEKIGMPVGGVGAGQLYLGGDGRLWHWDVFNQPHPTGDAHYANPPGPASPLDQGFALSPHVRRQAPRLPARPPRLLRRHLPRRIPDRPGRVPRQGPAGDRVAGGLLAVHPPERRRLQPARDGDAVHGEEHGDPTGRGERRRLAGERGLPPHGNAGTVVRTNRVVQKDGLTCLECAAEPAAAPATRAARAGRGLRRLRSGTLRRLDRRRHRLRRRAGREDRRCRPTRATSAATAAGSSTPTTPATAKTSPRATRTPASSPASRSPSSGTTSTSSSAAAGTRARPA